MTVLVEVPLNVVSVWVITGDFAPVIFRHMRVTDLLASWMAVVIHAIPVMPVLLNGALGAFFLGHAATSTSVVPFHT